MNPSKVRIINDRVWVNVLGNLSVASTRYRHALLKLSADAAEAASRLPVEGPLRPGQLDSIRRFAAEVSYGRRGAYSLGIPSELVDLAASGEAGVMFLEPEDAKRMGLT